MEASEEDFFVPFEYRSEYPVLVIDDIIAARRVLKKMLQNLGFTSVYEAGTGAEALKILEEESLRAIISDHNLGDMKGTQIFETLLEKEDIENVAFIIISSDLDDDQIANARSKGLRSCLLKPLSQNTLEEELDDLFRRGAGYEEEEVEETAPPETIAEAMERERQEAQRKKKPKPAGQECALSKLKKTIAGAKQLIDETATKEAGDLSNVPESAIVDCLLAAIQSSVGAVSAEDVYEQLTSSGKNVSRSTLIRVLSHYKIVK